jgi:hypothetical protein
VVRALRAIADPARLQLLVWLGDPIVGLPC